MPNFMLNFTFIAKSRGCWAPAESQISLYFDIQYFVLASGLETNLNAHQQLETFPKPVSWEMVLQNTGLMATRLSQTLSLKSVTSRCIVLSLCNQKLQIWSNLEIKRCHTKHFHISVVKLACSMVPSRSKIFTLITASATNSKVDSI